MSRCPHQITTSPLDLQANALRVEIIEPARSRCMLLPKRDGCGRLMSPARYIGSGGDPIGCCEPCVGRDSPRCPLAQGRDYIDLDGEDDTFFRERLVVANETALGDRQKQLSLTDEW